MFHRVLPWAVIVLALLLGAGLADAQRGKSGNNKNSSSKRAETFTVVKVGDTYDVVAKSELKSFKKKVSEQYRADLKAWTAAKKAASKAREKFTEKKPKAQKVSVVKKGIKSEGEARSIADRLTEKLRSRGASAGSKPKADPWVVADVDGNLQVMRKSELTAAKKKADAAYRAAMKEWTSAKKAAARAKSPFDEPRPEKSIIKAMGGSFKTEDAARARCDKLRAKQAKKAARGKKSKTNGERGE